jgi:hypothetical protein
MAVQKDSKIAFITAIYGPYEASCKPYVKQTVNADFICFTNIKNIKANGWIIDTTAYHDVSPSPLDTGCEYNSLKKNRHTFNIAKYYKQAFINIKRLSQYDVVVWLDGTVEIINPNTAEYLLEKCKLHNIVAWEHERRYGNLFVEVKESNFNRYTSTRWFNQDQPYQDVNGQYRSYLNNGYDEGLWKRINPGRKHLGVWITCCIAFNVKSDAVVNFLNTWYKQTLDYTTQDQIGFPYTVQKMNLIPYTLPDMEIKGKFPHERTDIYIKHPHGK